MPPNDDLPGQVSDYAAVLVNIVSVPLSSMLIATTCAELTPLAFSADEIVGDASIDTRSDFRSSSLVRDTSASTCERTSGDRSLTSTTWTLRIVGCRLCLRLRRRLFGRGLRQRRYSEHKQCTGGYCCEHSHDRYLSRSGYGTRLISSKGGERLMLVRSFDETDVVTMCTRHRCRSGTTGRNSPSSGRRRFALRRSRTARPMPSRSSSQFPTSVPDPKSA